MHSHRPFSTLRRWLASAALVAALGGAYAVDSLAQEPVAAQPVPAPVAPTSERIISIEVGEKTQLRADSGKKIRTVLVSRPGVAKFDAIIDVADVVTATGVGVGRVEATLVDELGQATRIIIRVLPDLAYIRDAIYRHFPRTSLTIEKVGENSVVVTGEVELGEQIPSILRLIESMVGQGYVVNNMRQAGVMQVQLEVCLAQVRRNEIRNMGFDWLISGRDAVFGNITSSLVPVPFTGPAVTSQTIPPGFLTTSRVGGGIGTQPAFTGGTANLFGGVFDEATSLFYFLEALRQENLAKIMANPTLVTLSGRPAFFNVGGQEPYGTAGSAGTSGGGGSGIQFQPFGTNVRFLPIVLGNGRIRIEVQPEVSDVSDRITQANIVAPRLTQTRVETTVEIESGQTMVIGGLIQSKVSGNTTKVPVLGDLPFIGAGFRTVTFSEEEVELLVIVTPHLVDSLDACQRPTRLPGQETRTPTDFELFLEGILEAPRGQRPLCPDGCYRPAHYWAPSHCLPYGTPKGAQAGGYGAAGCGTGTCGVGCGDGCGTHAVTRPAAHAYEVIPAGKAAPAAANALQMPVKDVPPLAPIVPAQYVPEQPVSTPEAPPMPMPNSEVQRPEPVEPVETPKPVPSEPVKPMEEPK
jgi:pilus assembly protein CpaC